MALKRKSGKVCMHKNLLIVAAGAVALIAPTASAQDAGQYVRPYWWDRPVVEGLGRAIIEVAPNRARFDLAFVETDAQSDEAMKKAVQRSKIAYDAIKKVAGDKARVTTSVNVNAYYEQYRDKEGRVQTNQRADQVEGYEARVLDDGAADRPIAGGTCTRGGAGAWAAGHEPDLHLP